MVRPRDATIFSEETFAFAELNQNAVSDLLGRTLADGGGNTFYNMALTPGAGARGWVELDGETVNANPTAAGPGFHSDSGGVQVGADASVGGTGRIGVALGYDRSWLNDQLGGKGNDEVFRASLYASQPVGPIGLSAVFSYAHAWNTTDRATGLGTAGATFGASQITGAVQAVAPFKTGGVLVTPAAGVMISRLTAGAFAETDGASSAFAVAGSGVAQTFVSPYAKLVVSHDFVSASGVTWTPDAQVGYRYDRAAGGQDFTLVAADGTVFAGNRVALDRGSALLGASLTAHKGAWTVYAKYRAQISGNWNDQGGAIGFRMAF